MKGFPVADFCSARSRTIPPPQWCIFAPPLTDGERTYLQIQESHIVLQLRNHTGRHRGGGPMHFALTVTEETFDEIADKLAGSMHFTRGPYGEAGKGRALFMIDPDGNETEINTRYLYGTPQR